MTSKNSDFAGEVCKAASDNADNVSPLVIQCLYSTGTSYAWYVTEHGSESHLASLIETREVLELLRHRWSVAGKPEPLCMGREMGSADSVFQATTLSYSRGWDSGIMAGAICESAQRIDVVSASSSALESEWLMWRDGIQREFLED